MNELTIIVTTCHRLPALKRCIESIREFEPDCKIQMVIDDNDVLAYLYAIENNIPAILSSEKRECVNQVNLGVDICSTEYFVFVTDDMVFTQKNQMVRSLETFKGKYPDGNGLITFNDGICNEAVATQGMTSKTYVKTLGGFLMDPTYIHYCGDTELTLISMERNCYTYLPEIKIQHDHHSITGKSDIVYEQSEKMYWQRDYAEFVKRWGEDCIEELKQGTWKGKP